MANSARAALDALGTPGDDPRLAAAKRALKRLTVERGDATYCQPCVSPVWDTALAVHALMEVGGAGGSVAAGSQWLAAREANEPEGDWSHRRPGLTPGGWAFQYRNDFYPDVGRGDGAAPGRRRSLPRAGSARRALGLGHAKQGRRLRLVRRRQYPLSPQQHPLCRSRRPSRSAHRRRERALSRYAGPARPRPRTSRGLRRRRLPQARTGSGRLMVWPLGRQLHLRHLVGALCVERGG